MKFVRTAVALSLSLALSAGALAPSPVAAATSPQDLRGVATDPMLRRAFVTDRDSATVSIIDLDNLTRVAAVSTGAIPIAVVSDSALSRLYVLNDASPGSVAVLNAESGAVLRQIGVGDSPRFLAADLQRGELYVSNGASGTLSIVDLRVNAVVATIPVGTTPAGIGVDTVRARIYVANDVDATVTVIDQNSREVINTVPVGNYPRAPAVDERTGRVYVNNTADSTVSVLDGDTGALVTMLASGRGSTSGTLSAVYRKYYLPNADDNTVTVIDIDTNRVVDTLRVGQSPQQASVDADSSVVYVANRLDNTISVIDARDDRPLGAVQTRHQPLSVAIPASQDHVLIIDDAAAGLDSVTALDKSGGTRDTAIAEEYYHAGFDQFFHTTGGVEKRLLSDGIFGADWKATSEYFRVWTAGGTGHVPVCRFFSTGFEPRSAHVYALYPECTMLKMGRGWQFESIAYYVAMPDASGACATGLEPLYRLYNGGQGGAPNHRFTANAAVRDAMQAKGWVAEGSGAQHVFACTPALLDASVGDTPMLLTAQTPIQAPIRVVIPPRPRPEVGDDGSVSPPTMVRLPLAPDARPLAGGDTGAQHGRSPRAGSIPLLGRPN
jgi:YVTN family beta-propeller protein